MQLFGLDFEVCTVSVHFGLLKYIFVKKINEYKCIKFICTCISSFTSRLLYVFKLSYFDPIKRACIFNILIRLIE